MPRPTRGSPEARVRAEVEREVARIHTRIAEAEAAFYAVGTMLLGLDRPEVLAAFGATTFAAFLDAHVMPAATANRYMSVAREFEAEQAAELGVLKAFHLVQYARVARTRVRAAALAKRDARIGKPARRLSSMTAAEVADAVRQVKMDAGRAAVPKASSRERRAAQRLVSQFEERFGMDASMRIDKKRGVLRLEVKLRDLVEEGGRHTRVRGFDRCLRILRTGYYVLDFKPDPLVGPSRRGGSSCGPWTGIGRTRAVQGLERAAGGVMSFDGPAEHPSAD